MKIDYGVEVVHPASNSNLDEFDSGSSAGLAI